jgi:hypothetical protein
MPAFVYMIQSYPDYPTMVSLRSISLTVRLDGEVAIHVRRRNDQCYHYYWLAAIRLTAELS